MAGYGSRRHAMSGELCTCGRPAREVYTNPDGTEIGYCGIPDGGDRTGLCPFCGGKRHQSGPCPQYQLRPPATAWDRHDDPDQQPDRHGEEQAERDSDE